MTLLDRHDAHLPLDASPRSRGTPFRYNYAIGVFFLPALRQWRK
jgi:hypothetical protein